ncbi:hypothetical protein BVC80_209g250 [Macleaya cordata]|uniref:Protein EARLY FLOWERING 3 n=1 Tax=Macleaya cordata TaxID=56857 RepID=A0A200QDE8_MACCD|nr:hypothetical protein BVC80_209g250 [Macleaya cordata]
MRRGMKGGKDEKIMGPLFPRLHINDTERAGPRAPPRNKMALYEQLTIPSQRCSTGQTSSVHLPPNNGSILVPPASSSQGGRHERTVFSFLYGSPPTPAHLSDKLHSGSFHGVHLNMTTCDFERKSMKNANCPSLNDSRYLSWANRYAFLLPKDFSNSKNSCGPKAGVENDLRFPAFIHSTVTQSSSKYPHSIDRERHTQSSPSKPDSSKVILGSNMPNTAANSLSSSMQLHNAREKHLKRSKTTDLISRQHGRNHSEENLKESSSHKEMQKLASYSSTKGNTSEPSKHGNVSLNQDHESGPMEDIEEEDNIDARKHQEYKAGFLLKNTACPRASLLNGHQSANEAENGRNYCDEKARRSLQVGSVDINYDSSEASMVDSISGLEISPEDVVGAIGQKQFWNTRRAIVNQQRLFAKQVFELHRLIKVQRLIAGSPHLVLEDNPYFSKPSLELSSAKKFPSVYVLSPPKIKSEDESQKPNASPNSAVVKPPNPSPDKIIAKDKSQKPNQGPDFAVVNPSDPSPSDDFNKRVVTKNSSYDPYSGNLPPLPVATENKAVPPWCFHPLPGSQWLLPRMPPSEGLVNKPYTGENPQTAGFMAPIYGGWWPMPVPSMEGGCLNPAFGFPGLSILVSPAAQAYPLVMSAVNSASPFEEGSSLAGAQPDWQAEQSSTGGANFSMKSGCLSNSLNQNDETISCVKKTQAPRDGELQETTMTSPCRREAQGVTAVPVSEQKDKFPLIPTTPALVVSDRFPQTENNYQQTTAIRVVPHNPRTAPESVARIFRFIQEERQQ